MSESTRELELDVTNVAHGGVFVARHEGRVVFVADAIPGERVLARVSENRHDRFWRAETIRVLDPSPDRQEHVWSAASLERDPDDRAGGAEFGHITLERQRALKAEVLRDALSRFAKTERDTVVEPAIADPERPVPGDGTRWRTRVTLHVDRDGRVGPYAARSHRVITVPDLPLAVASIERAAPLGERRPGARSIALVQPADGPVVIDGHDTTVRERVGDREFEVDAAGFWQVHPHSALTLSTAVQEAIDEAAFDPEAPNLDLYGGVGLLAGALGDRFGPATAVTSVESAASATASARLNLADLPGADAVTARVERFLERLDGTATGAARDAMSRATVVLDPPRSGLGREVVERIVALGFGQVIYVACDPVAFARDAGLLAQAGYGIQNLRAFDLFPHTHHLEAVAALAR